jgi:hypothetical protein
LQALAMRNADQWLDRNNMPFILITSLPGKDV